MRNSLVVIFCLFPLMAFPATFSVTVTNDSGIGSLRQAITDANANAGADMIDFAIVSAGKTISLASALPAIADPVTIDGTTQPGFTNAPIVELIGTSAGAGVDGLRIITSNCVIRALVINRFTSDGIEIATNGFNTVVGCYIGLGTDGITARANTQNGILITNSSFNTIGGLDATNRNYLSGNTQCGVQVSVLSASNNILGNIIGLDIASADKGNAQDGVRVNGSFNTVGGAAAGARNIIAGNNSDGVEIGTGGTNTIVQGNFLGTDGTGILDRGNSADGIFVNGATGCSLGGTNSGEGNRIVFNNSDGIELTAASATMTRIYGNSIGTDSSGQTQQANGVAGVNLTTNCRTNFIGGVDAGQANIIAYNTGDGVFAGSGTNNVIRGNSIFDNGGLGIDVAVNGVTANDNGDPDLAANLSQNFPVLTAATNSATEVIIAGSLNSKTNGTYTIDFYSNWQADATGNGEGREWLGSTNVFIGSSSNVTFLVTFATPTVGRYIVATATDGYGNSSEFSAAIRSVSLVPTNIFTVVNTNDSGVGSLRLAIISANSLGADGTNAIAFNIPGSGVQVIAPLSPLPVLVDSVKIDGYTQPGSSANTLAAGFDGVPLIRLSGALAGTGVDGLQLAGQSGMTIRGLIITGFGGDGIEISSGTNHIIAGCLIGVDSANTDQGNTANGILISTAANTIGGTSAADRNIISGNTSDGVEITGAAASGNLVLGNFIGTDMSGATNRPNSATGILVSSAPNTVIGGMGGGRNIISGNSSHGISLSAAANTSVKGNYIGTDVNGTIDRGNSTDGINASGATNSVIGGTSAGEGNLISGNGNDGIEITAVGATNILVRGNFIGVSVTGTNALGNGNHGVQFTTSARFNRIGGTAAGEANLIAFNTGDGVYHNGGTNNVIRGNSIHSNAGMGIDLGTSGVTANDLGDPDTGANRLQNFPVLTSATNGTGGTTISGTLNSATNSGFTIDFYSNVAVDSATNGEGQIYLGSTSITTDAAGNAAFSALVTVTNLIGRYICSTATDTNGNTSEFSANVFAVSELSGATFTVINTNDSGAGSLRQAITDANASITSGDFIAFNIPGSGVQTIRPLTALPTIIDPVTIDGYTQPGSVTNSSVFAFNGTNLIRLNFTNAPSNTDGLRFTVGNNTVRGLVIINALGTGSDGLDFSGGGSNVVEGCLIGIDVDGTDRGNGGNGILFTSSPGNRIGGTNLAACNVISGNSGDGIEITGATSVGNLIYGNLIGTDLTGLLDRGNSVDGILLNAASSTSVGSTNTGSRNVISGNNGDGIQISGAGATNNLVARNYIGLDVTGTVALGNGNSGVNISGVPNNFIGGTATAARNIISGNSVGVTIASAGATNNLVRGNFIGTDTSGLLDFGNADDGIVINGAMFNVIGGAAAGAWNLISGNNGDGVEITGLGAGTNFVQGNYIGLGANGGTSLGNGGNGVLITASARGNFIGGTNAGENNYIWFNGEAGVLVASGTNNAIRANSIADNDLAFNFGGLGIDLGDNGFTANDAGDADTGANNLQNFPVLTAATNSETSLILEGTLNSAASTTFALDFFAAQVRDSAGMSEGPDYLGAGTVTTDGTGNGSFSLTLPVSLARRFVTATATDPNGNTSEFSLPFAAASTIPATNFVVTTTNNSGAGSLLDAINLANSYISDGQDIISFNIPGPGPHTIAPSSSLRSLLDAVLIDGFTQSGAQTNSLCDGNNAVLQIRLDGSNAGASANGLYIDSPGGVTVRGLCIVGFGNDGIEIARGPGHVITGNSIGFDTIYTLYNNGQNGINLSSGTTFGNFIGGSSPGARNVISGNTSDGIRITGSASNTIAGNFIGTEANGTLIYPNYGSGIYITGTGARGNLIGGSGACERNVISGNGNSSDDDGVRILSAIGTRILGNYIGVDVTGTNQLGNYWTAVSLESGATQTQVGGTNPGEGNVLSGSLRGMMIISSHTNTVLGNLIGTDATGTRNFGNSNDGIEINSSRANVIGGPSGAARNVISGNGSGIEIIGSSGSDNLVQGNYVGADITGTNALPNYTGIGIYSSAQRNLVGGTNAGAGNLIAFNTARGIELYSPGTANTLVGNSLHSNGGLGIDLDANGVTPNDAGDTDTGANERQNFPVLTTYALSDTNSLAVTGTFNSTSNQIFRLDFYASDELDPSGFGEGKTYLGGTEVTTDATGNTTFAFASSPAPVTGQFITATATATNGSTSEFSAGTMVVPFDSANLVISLTDTPDPASVTLGYTYEITLENFGPTNAAGVFVTNTLPAGVNFVSATASQGVFTNSGNLVIFDVGTLDYTSNALFTINVTGISSGWVTNTATVVSGAPDAVQADNSDMETTLLGLAELSVSVTDVPDPVSVATTTAFAVTVTNAGPDTATAAVLSFNLDGNFLPGAASSSQGLVSQAGNYFTVDLGSLAAGGSAMLTLDATGLNQSIATSYAYVSAAEGESDYGDNAWNESTTIEDGTGVFTLADASVWAAEGAGQILFTINRSGSVGTVTVDLVSSNLTAVAGSDFTGLNRTITFNDGESTTNIAVVITDDATAECNETFLVTLRNATGGALIWGNTNATAYIFDDEIAASGNISGASLISANVPTTGNNASTAESENINFSNASISDDGRYVAFASAATDLVGNPDENGDWDVFLHDRVTGSNVLISATVSGIAGNGPSEHPLISADGRVIIFGSTATDLVTNSVSGGNQQLFAYVRNPGVLSGLLRLVSVSTNGAGASASALNYNLSTNGNIIVFNSGADNLSFADPDGTADVYAYDLLAQTMRLISVTTNGTGSDWLGSGYPMVSADGNVVSFYSYSDALVNNDTNGTLDMFVRNIEAATTELVSVDLTGYSAPEGSGLASRISGNGRYVVFLSAATNIVTGTTIRRTSIFVTPSATPAPLCPAPTMVRCPFPTGGLLEHRAISHDGRYVLFETTAANFAAGDTPTSIDVFRRDTWSNTTNW